MLWALPKEAHRKIASGGKYRGTRIPSHVHGASAHVGLLLSTSAQKGWMVVLQTSYEAAAQCVTVQTSAALNPNLTFNCLPEWPLNISSLPSAPGTVMKCLGKNVGFVVKAWSEPCSLKGLRKEQHRTFKRDGSDKDPATSSVSRAKHGGESLSFSDGACGQVIEKCLRDDVDKLSSLTVMCI